MGFFKELKEDLYQAIRELTSDDNDTDKPQEKNIDRTVKDNVAHEEIAVIASDIIITGNIKSDSSVEITGIVLHIRFPSEKGDAGGIPCSAFLSSQRTLP
jgi:carbonic anhydrase